MDRVTDDYGQRVNKAFRAVRQLLEDSQRLLRDCDSTIGIGKGKELATRSDQATTGLSGSLSGNWCTTGAYRCYQADPTESPGLVDAICLALLGDDKVADYPLLLLGRIQYPVEAGQDVRERCDGWHLWQILEHAPDPLPVGEVVRFGQVKRRGKPWIERARMVAVPLYSVKSIDDVVELMDRVRAE